MFLSENVSLLDYFCIAAQLELQEAQREEVDHLVCPRHHPQQEKEDLGTQGQLEALILKGL